MFVRGTLGLVAAVALVGGGCFPDPPAKGGDVDDSVADALDTAGADTGGEAPDTLVVDTAVDTTGDTAVDATADATADTATAEVDAADGGADVGEDTVVAPECTSDGACAGLDAPPCLSGRCVSGACEAVVTGGFCDDGDPCTNHDACSASGCHGVPWTGTEAKGWYAVFDGPATDYATGVAIHPSGDVSVVGSFEDTADLAGASLTSRGSADAFVARFAPDGTRRWVVQAGGDGLDLAMATTAVGEDVVVAGWFTGTASFGAGADEKLLTAPSGASFVATYGSLGRLKSVWKLDGFVHRLDALRGTAMGDVLVTGRFSGTLRVPSASTSLDATSAGGFDVFLVRATPDGLGRWVARLGSAEEDALGFISAVPVAVSPNQIALTYLTGGADATYRVGTNTSVILASEATREGIIEVGLDGAITSSWSQEGVSFTSGLAYGDTGLIVTGFAADDQQGTNLRLFVESRVGSAEIWSQLVRGSGLHPPGNSFPMLVPVVAFGEQVLTLGLMERGELILAAGVPLSPVLTSDDDGVRSFVARYEASSGTARGGAVTAVPLAWGDDAPYKASLHNDHGGPELMFGAYQAAQSGAQVCFVRVTTALDGVAFETSGWFAGEPAVPGGAGIVVCLPPAHVYGCGVN
ncbi:MAG: hypothetical protein KC635_13425 [Myxococcales bacterium]|nr:hypothetical protein [Myxococcales bacterium]